MRKRFVVSFGMILLMPAAGISARAQAGNHIAGFDTRWIKDYEPSREDGVSMVGEPDWDAEFEKAGPALAAGELAASVGQVLVTAGEAQESSGEDGGAAEPGAAGEESGTEADTEAETDAQEAAADGWVSLGDDWVITYYCPLSCCNDQWAWQTSTQEPMQLHHTIAVDPSVIPYYTHVRIGGLDYEYVAEDCGGGIKGKRIDVLVDNCTIANRMGVDRNVEVWVKR